MKLYRNVKLLSLIIVILAFMAVITLMEEDNDGLEGMSGNLVYTHAEIIPVEFRNCSFQLYPGWNMVSFYCLGLYSPTSIALQSLEGSYGSVFEYMSNDHVDPWKSYNSSLPTWTVQQLTYLDRLSGYWVYMNNTANFSYSGVYSDSVIQMYDGWNLVGYPNTLSQNISFMLNGTSFTLVKNYRKITANSSVYDNNTNTTYNVTYYTGSDEWLVYVNGSASNNLTQFGTYRGYWINVSGNRTWNIVR